MDSKFLKSIVTPLLAPLAALCMATAAQAQTAQPMASSASMPMGPMHKGVGGMDGMQKMPMSGDSDKDFAMMMKMHHQQGVEMAKRELAKGKSPEMKAMATQIIAAQNKEIAEFDRWLSQQK